MLANETDKIWDIGYVSGTFDMFHIGHLNLIKNAKARCRHLIVAVLDEECVMEKTGGKPPVIPTNDRVAIVEACRYVDEVDITTKPLLNKVTAWEKYHFGAMFSGDDHASDGWGWEEPELANRGAELVFFPYTKKISTTMLKKQLGK
jgi:cytidyltransferase-like protein